MQVRCKFPQRKFPQRKGLKVCLRDLSWQVRKKEPDLSVVGQGPKVIRWRSISVLPDPVISGRYRLKWYQSQKVT